MFARLFKLACAGGALCVTLGAPSWAIDIDQCDITIDQPGDYDVVADLVCPVAGEPCTCIRVRSSDVTVNLNGYELTGFGGGPGRGAPAGISLVDVEDVKVEGPGTITNFSRGFTVIRSNNVEIDGLTVEGGGNGARIIDSSDVEVENSTLRNQSTGHGMFILRSNSVEVREMTIENASPFGIRLSESEDTSFRDLTVRASRFSAVVVANSNGTSLENVIMEQNSAAGMFFSGDSQGNTVKRCTIVGTGATPPSGGPVSSGIIFTANATDNKIRLCHISDTALAIQVGGTINGPTPQAVADTRIRETVISGNGAGIVVLDNAEDTRLRDVCIEDSLFDNLNDQSADGVRSRDLIEDPDGLCPAPEEL